MTAEEFAKVQFKLVAHLSLEHEHCSTHTNEDYGLAFCKHTKKKDDYTFGRSYIHYMYRGVVYKTKAKFLEAIKDLEFKG